ncbi:MAG: SPOR domain-containing protein [Terricaulis silvestris]
MAKFDPRQQAIDDQTRVSGAVYIVMMVIAAAFAAFVWNLYATHDAPVRITPPPGAYKIAPPAGEQAAIDAGESGAAPADGADEIVDTPPATTTAAAASTAHAKAPAPPTPAIATTTGAPQLGAAPVFVNDGPFVVQVAALQSEAAVQPAWARLSSRAPQLFAAAKLDVERADLGARGVYYRVRAGYFADRDNARRFCARITQMGQDCVVVQR